MMLSPNRPPKHHPRSRFGWLLVAVLVFSLSTPLWAEDGEREEEYVEPYRFSSLVRKVDYPDEYTLEFDGVAAAIKAGSPLIMSTKVNREVTSYNLNQLAEQQRSANNSVASLNTAMNALGQMRSGLDAAFAAAGAAGQPPSATEQLLKSAVDAQLSMSQSQLSSQALQAATADRGYTTTGSMATAITQMDDGSLQVIYSGLSLYHGYWMAERQIEQAEEQLVLLRRQCDVVAALEEMGRATTVSLQDVRDGISAMEQGIKTARLEQQGLLNELNALLGRPASSTLILAPMPEPDIAALQTMDYDTVWKASYKQSYVLKGKRYTQGGWQQQYDDIVKISGEFGDRAWRAEQQVEAAKVETALAAEQLEIRFQKLFEKTQQSLDSYALEAEKLAHAEANLERAEQKYELGYLSYGDLLRLRSEVNSQRATYEQAGDDLSLSWQRWQLIMQGMDISSGDSR